MTQSSGPVPSRPAQGLDTLVYRLVHAHVRNQAEQRSGIRFESFRDKKIKDHWGRERIEFPDGYVEAREAICAELFLGFRARRESEFTGYFSEIVASVAQGANLPGESEFKLIAEALLDPQRWQDVRTLAMLAVSSASYAPAATPEDTPPEQQGK